MRSVHFPISGYNATTHTTPLFIRKRRRKSAEKRGELYPTPQGQTTACRRLYSGNRAFNNLR
ncbi:hypothetical protein MRBBS_3342 [Marinobacter sp. BSs20148]|nr:hypothetical protein MRBBS_3342 [Marinobacter sp. BSs20148]